MVLPVFKIRRGVMIICAVLATMSGVKTLQWVQAGDAHDRLQALHQARKQTVLEAVASLQDRLGILASHPLLTSHLQNHQNRWTNTRPSASTLAALYAQANKHVTAAYLEQNQASHLLGRLHQQLQQTPAWAAEAILAAPSPTLRQIRTLSSLAGFNDLTLIDGQTGRVILTARQRFDLGASLMTPPLISSDLGRFFAQASSRSYPDKTIGVLQHQPFIHSSTLGFAHALHSAAGAVEGILIAHVSTAQVDRWLNKNGQWHQLGYRADEQSFLIGPGAILRSQWRAFDEQPDNFVRSLMQSSGTAAAAKLLNQPSAAGLLKVDDPWIQRHLHASVPIQGAIEGKHVLMEKLPLAGLSWSLVTEVHRAGSHLLLWPGILIVLVLIGLTMGFFSLQRRERTGRLEEQVRLSEQELRRHKALLEGAKQKHKLDLKKVGSYRAQVKRLVRGLQTELHGLRERHQQEVARAKTSAKTSLHLQRSLRRLKAAYQSQRKQIDAMRRGAVTQLQIQALRQAVSAAEQTANRQAAVLRRHLAACEKDIITARAELTALAPDAVGDVRSAEQARARTKKTFTIKTRLDRTQHTLNKLLSLQLQNRSLAKAIADLKDLTRDHHDKSA